jgi:DinB family protein
MRSTRRRVLYFSALVPFLSRFVSGQNSQTPAGTAAVFNKHMDWMEEQFIPAAEAMPEDKFFWAPTSGEFHGVRNFAEQLIHVAEVNFALSAAILVESSPKRSPAEAMKTRSAVLQYLKDSFANTHRAFSSITEQNAKLPIKHPLFDMVTTRMGLSIVAIAHPFDHYGQIVEYLRMNNIVPPASRN